MRLLKKLTMPCFLAILFVLGISLVSLKANAAPSETEKDGKFFAGYYQDSALTVPSSTETANVKWVRNGVLSLKMQARLKDEKIDIRLLSTVDTLNYSQVGFRIAYDQNGNGTFESTEVTSWNTNSVTQEISANNSTFIYRYDPKVIDTDSCYFITAILSGIPAANWDKAFLIEPFWITMDGTTVYGQSRWFTVNDIQAGATNLNISAKMDASAFDTATVSGIEGATVRNSYYDGKYGHFNLTVADRTALASITPVTVGGTTVYYRNLQNTAAKDTSWYTVPNSLGETKFVVATAADMYGIRDYDTAFANKTIYLVTDIDLNDVSKVNWATGEAASGYTPTQWRAIGRVNYAFTGTFDGQGHTINGLYLTDTSGAGNNFLGLFGRVYGGSVRNVSLKNSYIQSASETVGAIVGQIENGGSFTNLYSNATVKGSRAFIGGLFGKSNSGRVYMSRCWFDGSVISTSSGNSRGFVGGIVAYCPAGTLVLDNCLNSGRIDVSAMSQTNSSYGTGGILGVRTGTIYMVDCAVVGTVTKGASSGFTGTYVGDRDAGMMLGFDNYRVNNGWDGNYGGAASTVIYFGMTNLSAADMTGDAAKTNIPAFDWTETWQTRDGAYPALNVRSGKSDSFVDVSWYNTTDTSFTLDSMADLQGLAKLVNIAGNTFTGKSLTLVNDVVLNTGNAADWAANAPQFNWTPIGIATVQFKGSFDGQMHTISGLYTSGADRVGLFGCTTASTIQNVKLKNSYFASTGQWIGSFAGQGSGTFSNLYSNAILTTSAAMIGGIVGANDDANKANLTMDNCWFDGSVTSTHSAGANSGAFVGGLVGFLSVGTNQITNCLMTGTIDVSAFVYAGGGNMKTGGLVGVNSTPNSTTINSTACLATFIPGSNANKAGMYAIGGDTSQRNLTGSNNYAVVDNHFIAGGYNSVSSGFSFGYNNIGGAIPTGATAQTKMPNLDWANTWQVRDGKVPALSVFGE